MKKLLTTFAFVALSITASAHATEINRSARVYSAEGRMLGIVDRVLKTKEGEATAVTMIFDGKLIQIPASTLSNTEKGLTTTLSKAEVRKL